MARQLCRELGIPHLDLDSLAWESAGVRKTLATSIAEMEEFVRDKDDWIIEGCFGSLLQVAAGWCSEMRFHNPGVEVCINNNQARPWEPHKYSSPAAQDRNLQILQQWVGEYEARQDEYSLHIHQGLFSRYRGSKREYR